MEQQYRQIKDPVRTDKLVCKIEVVNRNTHNLALPTINNWSPNIVQPGTSVVSIYEDDLASVQAMVEPRPELLELAKETLENKLQKRLRDQKKSHLKRDSAEVLEEIASLHANVPGGTVEACFKELTGDTRDLLPLEKVTVLEKGIVIKEAVNPMTEALLAAQASAGGKVDPDMIAAIVASTLKAMGASGQQNSNQRNR